MRVAQLTTGVSAGSRLASLPAALGLAPLVLLRNALALAARRRPAPLLRFSPAPPVAAPGAAAPAASSGRQLSGSRARHGSRAEVGAGRGVGGGGCWEWPGWGGGCAAAAATTVVSIDRHAPRRCFGRSRPPPGTALILRSSIPRRAPGGAACGCMAVKASPCQRELDESRLDGAHAGRRGDQQRP